MGFNLINVDYSCTVDVFSSTVVVFDSEHCESVQLHTAFIKKVCCCVECCMLEFMCCCLHVDFTVVMFAVSSHIVA